MKRNPRLIVALALLPLAAACGGGEVAPGEDASPLPAAAWIRGKGLTYDVSSRDGYSKLLDRLPELQPLDEATAARARRYAYHYFFRRMIPLSSLEPGSGIPPQLRVRSLDDLRPGRDTICAGILNGTPFVFDEG